VASIDELMLFWQPAFEFFILYLLFLSDFGEINIVVVLLYSH